MHTTTAPITRTGGDGTAKVFQAPRRFDVHEVAPLEAFVRSADGSPIVIDLSGTTFVDQTAITSIKRVEARWRRRRLPCDVRRSFAVSVIFDLVETIRDAEEIERELVERREPVAA